MVYKGIIMWLYAFGDILAQKLNGLKQQDQNTTQAIRLKKEVVGYISDSNSDVGQEHTWNSTSGGCPRVKKIGKIPNCLVLELLSFMQNAFVIKRTMCLEVYIIATRDRTTWD